MQALTAEAEAAVLADRGALPVPATVVWGAKDRTHARSDPARTLPGARVVRFEEAGHSPELEEPERFARSLLGWHEESP
jgi:pimeloyl-ACP methyl ester carboxylesterase